MVKISIIIPVYNCEQYLCECLESIFKQTLQEWEIICIDDGSTDQSESILREFEKRDSRVKVYKQLNQGAGVARNLGIKLAAGEYIAFLDADDFYLDADALEQMYSTCQNNMVNACGTNLRLLRNGIIVEDSGFKDVKQAAEGKEILDYRDFQFDYGYCGFIIKKDIIIKNHILFPEYRRFQDPPFFVQVMLAAEKFCFLKKALYCYRVPNVTQRFDSDRVADLLRGLIDNFEFAASNNLNLLLERTLQRLEVEYSNIICHYIIKESTEILELLIEMNDLVRRVYQKANYVISPLQRILGSVAEAECYHKEQLHRQMVSSNRIYIYGAGKATTDFLIYLHNCGMYEKVASIIVTDKKENPEEVKGISVLALKNYQYEEGDLILITVTSIYQKDIVQKLNELNILNYEIIDVSMF